MSDTLQLVVVVPPIQLLSVTGLQSAQLGRAARKRSRSSRQEQEKQQDFRIPGFRNFYEIL
jgi:hypothetical protein